MKELTGIRHNERKGMKTIVTIFASITLLLPCCALADSYDKEAYKLSQTAIDASSYEKASDILRGIEQSRIGDKDLREHVDYCKRVVEFCLDVGIPRDADSSIIEALKKLDWQKFLADFAKRTAEGALEGAPGGPKTAGVGAAIAATTRAISVGSTGGRLLYELNDFVKRHGKLDKRYTN